MPGSQLPAPGASGAAAGGSGSVAGILTSCRRAVRRSPPVLSRLLGGRNQPRWAALAGPGLAFWGLTVSLPVSELPARSGPEAQESHWLWGPQH